MVCTIVDEITSEYVILIVDDDEDFEIILETEWLPAGVRLGDMVEISFEVKPRKKKNSNVCYPPRFHLGRHKD